MNDRNSGGSDYAGGADKSRAEGSGAGEAANDTGKETAGTSAGEPREPSSAPTGQAADVDAESTERGGPAAGGDDVE